jgi:hypothetical protein
MHSELHTAAERAEARLLLRWAASTLNPTEKLALSAFMTELPRPQAAAIRGCTRGGIWMAEQKALKKMRRRFAELRITSSPQVLS